MPKNNTYNFAGIELMVDSSTEEPKSIHHLIESGMPISSLDESVVTDVVRTVSNSAMSSVITWAKTSARCNNTLMSMLHQLMADTKNMYTQNKNEYVLIPETYVTDKPIGSNTMLSIVKRGSRWEFEVTNRLNKKNTTLASGVYDVEKNSILNTFVCDHFSDAVAEQTLRDLVWSSVVSK